MYVGTAAFGCPRRATRAEEPRSDLAIFAVQQITHRFSASFVRFCQSFALIGVHAPLGCGLIGLRLTASRTAVGKTGLPRLQLKLFPAGRANFDRKCHSAFL